jgi:hypothetical protein
LGENSKVFTRRRKEPLLHDIGYRVLIFARTFGFLRSSVFSFTTASAVSCVEILFRWRPFFPA